jgi:hypothetical protein
MMIEKLFSLVISLVLLSLLAACGSSAEAQEQESDSYPNQSVEKDSGSYPNKAGDNEFVAGSADSTSGDSSVATLESGTSMRVLWTVSGYVIGKDATWGETEAQAMLFKPLDVTDTKIIFDGQVCSDVTFQRETVNTSEYLSDSLNTTPQDLGIDGQELQVIKTNCTLPGFQEYMRLNDRRLVVPINGVFLLFEPAVTY